MSGIAYDLTKIRGIVLDVDGVLSPSTIPTDEQGNPVRMVNIKDGYALQLAVKSGLKIAIITGGASEATKKRYNALGITDIFMKAGMKLPVMRKWMDDNGLKADEVLYMGDDIPDLKCLREVGLPCCPYDAASEVRQTALYISPVSGGYGCVRDVLRQILIAQDHWLAESKAFGW